MGLILTKESYLDKDGFPTWSDGAVEYWSIVKGQKLFGTFYLLSIAPHYSNTPKLQHSRVILSGRASFLHKD